MNCRCIGRCFLFCNQIPPPSQIIIHFQQRAQHGVRFHTFKFSSLVHLHLTSSVALSQVLPHFLLHLFPLIQFGYLMICPLYLLSIIFHRVSIIFSSFSQLVPSFVQLFPSFSHHLFIIVSSLSHLFQHFSSFFDHVPIIFPQFFQHFSSIFPPSPTFPQLPQRLRRLRGHGHRCLCFGGRLGALPRGLAGTLPEKKSSSELEAGESP